LMRSTLATGVGAHYRLLIFIDSHHVAVLGQVAADALILDFNRTQFEQSRNVLHRPRYSLQGIATKKN
jgi:hypothetical protein